jgi:hypothetical protein
MTHRLLPAVLLLLLACDSEKEEAGGDSPGEETGAPPVTSYYRDVKPLLERSCVSCHTEGALGGFALDQPDVAVALAADIADSVVSLRMPPWMPNEGCNEYDGDPSLSAEERDLIAAWAAEGGPLGDPAEAQTAEAWAAPALDRVDLTVSMPVDYTPDPSQSDDYRCFLVPWPETESVYVVGYTVRPGNLATVHHLINYLVPPGQVATYEALDAQDEAVGYPCFGGPGPEDLGAQRDTKWLGAWAPGGGASLFPAGTGIRVEPGSMIAMQMHYNNASGDATPDRTEVDFQLADTVEQGAMLQPWTDITWVVAGGMDIPANTNGVQHQFSHTVPENEDGFTLHSVSLHMHQMGVGGSMVVNHADGSQTCLVNTDHYDFNWQRSYQMVESVDVGPGDEVLLSCTWNNTTSADADWGENTGDEMCLGITYLTDIR